MAANNKPVDILVASHMHDIHGGAESALIEYVEALTQKGLKVHVVVGGDGEVFEKMHELGVGVTIIYMPWWVRSQTDLGAYNFRTGHPHVNSVAQLVSLIQMLQPKLCLTNTIVVPWLAYAASIARVRHAWLIHEMGTKGLNLDYYMGETQTLHTINTFADGFFFNSKTTADAYLPELPIEKHKGVIYPVGPLKPYTAIPNPYKNDASLKLISVGQVKPQKGQLVTVQAVKQLVDKGIRAELLIVGGFEDKEYVTEITDYIERHGLSNSVHLAGQKKEPSAYVEHADISVISATNEAFGRVTVEAMQLGKPVVGAHSGGTIEIIEDGKTGLLFKAGNAKDLASQIVRLTDKQKRLKIGNTAKKEAEIKYSNEQRFAPLFNYLVNIDEHPDGAIDLSTFMGLVKDYNEVCATKLTPLLLRFIPRKAKRFVRKIIRRPKK